MTNCRLYATYNPKGGFTLPDDFPLSHVNNMTVPDYKLIVRFILATEGFKKYRELGA